jgi:hypothetical protein
MSEQGLVRRFEVRVLRPLWIVAIASGILLAFASLWWSVGVAVLTVLALGTVGSGLHPLLTAAQLVEGPVKTAAAHAEAIVLPGDVQLSLVARACTQLAILIGLVLSWIGIALLDWRWFLAVPAAWAAATFVGGLLKFRFVLRTPIS